MRCIKGSIPDDTWSPSLIAIFESPIRCINILTLLGIYHATNPIHFLKTNWNTIGIGYIFDAAR